MSPNRIYRQWADSGYPPFYWGNELITKRPEENSQERQMRVEKIFCDIDDAQSSADRIMNDCKNQQPPENRFFSPPDIFRTNALILDLNNDRQTIEIFNCESRRDIRQKIQDSFLNATSHSGVDDIRSTVHPCLKKSVYGYVSITGHASPFSITGYDRNPILAINDSMDLIANGKVFFLTLCQTCVPEFGIGVTLAKNGAHAVFGYKNNLIVSVDSYVNKKYFYPSFFAAEDDFLNGNVSAKEALAHGKNTYSNQIRRLENDTFVSNRDIYVSMLKYDLAILCGPQAGDFRYGNPDYRL